MRRPLNKTTLLIVSIVTLLVGAGAAFAFWTAGGTGTGTASTGDNAAIEVVQTSVLNPLEPGLTAQSLSGTFNNGNTSPVYVATVTASISSVTKAAGAPVGTCDATDYTLSSAAMPVDAQIAPGDAQGTWTGATLAFNNKPAVNQDACKGATINLSYVIS